MARGFCTREITKYFIESSNIPSVRRPCGGVHCIIIGNKTQFYSPSADNTHYIIYIVFILRLNCINHEYKSSSGFQRASEWKEKKVNSFASRTERRRAANVVNGICNVTGGKENRKPKRENSVVLYDDNSVPLQTAYAENDDLPAYYSSNLTSKFTRFHEIHKDRP